MEAGLLVFPLVFIYWGLLPSQTQNPHLDRLEMKTGVLILM
jgi:hypothetical protein